MSALAAKMNGYQNATRAAGNPRDVEYQLFARITGHLNRAAAPDRPFAELATALDDNLRLWREIALDVAQPENGLPPRLRAQLFYLFEFTVHRTQKVLRNEADIAPLIEVNQSIMRGLRPNNPGKGSETCPV